MTNEKYGFVDDGMIVFKPKQCDSNGKKALDEVNKILEGAEETMDTFKEVQDKIQEIDNGLGYTKEEADVKFAEKTEVYTKSEADEAFATKEDIQSAVESIEIPSLEGYLTTEEAVELYQPKGEYLTEHQDLSEYAKTADVEAKLEEKQNKGDYVEYVGFEETRKTIQLENRDSISGKISRGGGANLIMVSGYSNLDFDVVEVGSTQTALVLNTCEGVVKIENKEHVQKTIATTDEIDSVNTLVTALEEKVAKLEDTISKLTMTSSEYATAVSKEISAGGDITIIKDVKIETGKDINLIKNSNVDLGGHTLSSVGGSYGDTCVVGNGADVTISNGEIVASDKATVGNGSATILVKTASASKLTLNNVKSTGIHPLYVNSANEGTLVTINGGEFYTTMDLTEVDSDHMAPAVYVGSPSTIGGKVIINNGTFGSPSVVNNFLLNIQDKLRQVEGKRPIDFIEVRGGKYYNFDPSNNKAEGQGTNFVAEGYKVTSTQSGADTIYEVSKA